MIPQHIGFILDGNRRWAREHSVPVIEGHRQGYQTLKAMVEAAFKNGVQYVSAYAFSSENWKRSQDEVNSLMTLLSWVLKNEVKEFHAHGYRLIVIGSRNNIKPALTKAIEHAETVTAANNNGTIVLCIDYSGQQEIINAVQQSLATGLVASDLTPADITNHLYAPNIPAPDLIIRSSGEQRLSNFLLWQSAYSELLFVDKNWPDFTTADLTAALQDYAVRKRRYGA